MRYPNEPHVLLGGMLVHVGAVGILEYLLKTGHAVMLDDDGGVVVVPLDDIPEQTLFCITAFEEDLALLLGTCGPTVH